MGLSDDHMLLTGLFILPSAQWWLWMTFLMETMHQSGLFSVLSTSQGEGFFLWTSLSMAIPIHSGDFSVTYNDCRHWHNILLFPRKSGIETCSFLCLRLLVLYPSVTAAVFKGWTEGWASSGFHRHHYSRVSCRLHCIDLIFLLWGHRLLIHSINQATNIFHKNISLTKSTSHSNLFTPLNSCRGKRKILMFWRG